MQSCFTVVNLRLFWTRVRRNDFQAWNTGSILSGFQEREIKSFVERQANKMKSVWSPWNGWQFSDPETLMKHEETKALWHCLGPPALSLSLSLSRPITTPLLLPILPMQLLSSPSSCFCRSSIVQIFYFCFSLFFFCFLLNIYEVPWCCLSKMSILSFMTTSVVGSSLFVGCRCVSVPKS